MIHPTRGIYCNRTLNLHGLGAIGYDMDYTLIHYQMEVWEEHAYGYLREALLKMGWPVGDLQFDPTLVTRGLIIDLALGNVVKANRFGYVKAARHGQRFLSYDELRSTYARTRIDLREPRWRFLNTLFSISEGCMYVQLVDVLDRGGLVGVSYGSLMSSIRTALDGAHGEGRLKEEIIADPDRFAVLDPDTPQTLLDQKDAGKRVLLITNSEWSYAAPMLSYAFDRFLPGEMTWRDLFDIAIVGARKPEFFFQQSPAFRVVGDDGTLREAKKLEVGGVYVGGCATLVEEALSLSGQDILYVGDHLFVDVNVSNSVARWRTALIIRELEEEITAGVAFRSQEQELETLMAEKVEHEFSVWEARLALQRLQKHRDPEDMHDRDHLRRTLEEGKAAIARLDAAIAPLAQASGALSHPQWGLLMRAGNDKSHLCRQVERYADIYTSRVSNFRAYTPFAYFRSPRGSLPHDQPPTAG